MENEEKPIIVSDDTGSKLHQADKALIESAKTGEGLIEIKSADALMELAQAAHETFQFYRKEVNKIISPERAEIIRDLRINQDCSWRMVAAECHALFQGTWEPESNQLAGMALCEAAAEHFGENYMDEKWN